MKVLLLQNQGCWLYLFQQQLSHQVYQYQSSFHQMIVHHHFHVHHLYLLPILFHHHHHDMPSKGNRNSIIQVITPESDHGIVMVPGIVPKQQNIYWPNISFKSIFQHLFLLSITFMIAMEKDKPLILYSKDPIKLSGIELPVMNLGA